MAWNINNTYSPEETQRRTDELEAMGQAILDAHAAGQITAKQSFDMTMEAIRDSYAN